jgi:hypothetical protein
MSVPGLQAYEGLVLLRGKILALFRSLPLELIFRNILDKNGRRHAVIIEDDSIIDYFLAGFQASMNFTA